MVVINPTYAVKWYDVAATVFCLAALAMIVLNGMNRQSIQRVEAPYSCTHMDQVLTCVVVLPDMSTREFTGHSWQVKSWMYELRAEFRTNERIHLVYQISKGVVL